MPPIRCAARGDVFISTNSLTKSYGLAGLRCGWIAVVARRCRTLRRARDVIDGTGSLVAERLARWRSSSSTGCALARGRCSPPTARCVRGVPRRGASSEWVDPRGGTVVFPRMRESLTPAGSSERLLDERADGVVPGRFFEAPAHFRLGFGGATDASAAASRR